ncbi:hypothetical protein GCM10009804_55640 [Kribbella hippodromi]|uniref:DUF3037 domain-containing protein n=1 Tax=Kribbella hippodromi TaxID=434347 RepID=A0ABP4PV88_9ACTN
MGYSYWLLRYVPDSARGEFVNVGLIVGSDEASDWAVRTVPSLARASRLGGDARVVQDWLDRIRLAVAPESLHVRRNQHESLPRLSLAWLDRIRRHLNNTLQISSPLPLRAASAESAADLLYDQLIVSSEGQVRSSERDSAVRELRDAFYTAGELSPREVQRRVRLQVGRQHARFEFAIGEQRIAQLSQVWSFNRRSLDGLTQDIQASSYAIKRLREHGGVLLNPGRTNQRPIDLIPDVAIRVLYVPPSSAVQREVFADAEDAWADLGVVPFPLGQAEHLAEEAAHLLRAS